jgi:hypothetical protein
MTNGIPMSITELVSIHNAFPVYSRPVPPSCQDLEKEEVMAERVFGGMMSCRARRRS